MSSNLPRFLHGACRSKWLFCAVVAAMALILSCWPDGVQRFRYDRAALATGEIWRFLSGHLVHLNTAHLLFNLLGLFLLCELLLEDFPVRHAAALSFATALGTSGFLWYLHPELFWYVGLSGVLHGLWAGGALAACRSRPLLGGLAFSLLLIKLMVEWLNGASAHVTSMIGAPVIIQAHFYGASVGMVYLLVWKLATFKWRKT